MPATIRCGSSNRLKGCHTARVGSGSTVPALHAARVGSAVRQAGAYLAAVGSHVGPGGRFVKRVGSTSRTIGAYYVRTGVRVGLKPANAEPVVYGTPAPVSGGSGIVVVKPVGPRIELYGPLGLVDTKSASLTRANSVGWRGSVDLPTWQDISLEELAPDAIWRMVVYDGFGFDIQSPPLVAGQRSALDPSSREAMNTKLRFTCLASYRMARNFENFDTFKNTTTVAIMKSIAARAQVTVNGVPSQNVTDEDAKQAKLADILNRYTTSQAYEWGVDTTGAINCFPWEATSGSLNFDARRTERSIDPQLAYTSIAIGKRSAIGGSGTGSGGGKYTFPFTTPGFVSFQLPTPLINCIPSNLPGLGYCDLVTCWTGDPTRNGLPVAFFQLVSTNPIPIGLVLSGHPPITHITCAVYPPAQLGQILTATGTQCTLQIVGTPYRPAAAAQVDPSFYFQYIQTNNYPTLNSSDWIDAHFQSEAVVQKRVAQMLWARRKGYDKLSQSGQMSCAIPDRGQFFYLPPGGAGVDYKIDSTTWARSAGGGHTSTIDMVRYQ